jgi:hypothetical protein
MPTKTKSSPAPRAKKSTPVAPDMLRLEYVTLETVTAWEKNPKKHDIGAIWESIQKHGLKDPPKFEPKLNGGKGGIVEGNGRSHVLREMRAAGENPPRGVVEAPGGSDWLIPVLFGVDAKSERAAVKWTLRDGDKVTGGTVYWLNDTVDGGPIAAQDYCFVQLGDTPETLWRRELFPMGLKLFARVLRDIESGVLVQIPQDDALATWEPSFNPPAMVRPDLPQLTDGSDDGYVRVISREADCGNELADAASQCRLAAYGLEV